MTKTFNIGECAIGGRVKITTDDKTKTVRVQCLDWTSKKVVKEDIISIHDRRELIFYLSEISTSYYGDQMMSWLSPYLPKEKIW